MTFFNIKLVISTNFWLLITCVLLRVIFTNAASYAKISTPDLIRADGYVAEIHSVTTEDGYILELHRIPYGRNETSSLERRPVAFLGHCIFCASSAFVVLGPTRALAYVLANNGYDVWLLNSRGTTYSKSHLKLSPKSREFWQFSWNEMGIYDLAAGIDHVLNATGEHQVDYIGFSMGTTQFFVLMSEKPEYNSKIRKMIAMAPVAYFNSTTGPFPIKPPYSKLISNYGADTGRLVIPPPEMKLNDLFVALCNPKNLLIFGAFCNHALWRIGAENNGNLNPVTLPYYLLHFPDTTSIRAAIHYTQLRLTGRFAKYDFGVKLNRKIYGSNVPPSYDLKKVTAPVSIFWSKNDAVSDYRDVARLEADLPNVEFSFEVPFYPFSHLDFIWGNNAKTLVYDHILEILKQQV